MVLNCRIEKVFIKDEKRGVVGRNRKYRMVRPVGHGKVKIPAKEKNGGRGT